MPLVKDRCDVLNEAELELKKWKLGEEHLEKIKSAWERKKVIDKKLSEEQEQFVLENRSFLRGNYSDFARRINEEYAFPKLNGSDIKRWLYMRLYANPRVCSVKKPRGANPSKELQKDVGRFRMIGFHIITEELERDSVHADRQEKLDKVADKMEWISYDIDDEIYKTSADSPNLAARQFASRIRGRVYRCEGTNPLVGRGCILRDEPEWDSELRYFVEKNMEDKWSLRNFTAFEKRDSINRVIVSMVSINDPAFMFPGKTIQHPLESDVRGKIYLYDVILKDKFKEDPTWKYSVKWGETERVVDLKHHWVAKSWPASSNAFIAIADEMQRVFGTQMLFQRSSHGFITYIWQFWDDFITGNVSAIGRAMQGIGVTDGKSLHSLFVSFHPRRYTAQWEDLSNDTKMDYEKKAKEVVSKMRRMGVKVMKNGSGKEAAYSRIRAQPLANIPWKDRSLFREPVIPRSNYKSTRS